MTHALANIAFEIGGLVALAALASTIWTDRAKIIRAIKRRG